MNVQNSRYKAAFRRSTSSILKKYYSIIHVYVDPLWFYPAWYSMNNDAYELQPGYTQFCNKQNIDQGHAR